MCSEITSVVDKWHDLKNLQIEEEAVEDGVAQRKNFDQEKFLSNPVKTSSTLMIL